MARGRMINTTIATDKRLNSMSQDAIMLFVMTVPHLDRDGLIVGDANLLYSRVCPRLPYMLARIEPVIGEWVSTGLVMRYETDEDPVLFFTGFNDNQLGMRYDREMESVYPPPPGFHRTSEGMFPDDSGNTPAVVGSDSGNTPAVVGSDSGNTPAVVGSDSGNTPATLRQLSGATPLLSINKDQDQDKNNTTTPTPPTETENSGGGGGDAHPVESSDFSNSPKTVVPVSTQVATMPVAPVTANAAPPVSQPPPSIEPLAELGGLLIANGFGELKPATRPQVMGWVSAYQISAIQDAIRIAAANGKNSLNYVEGVLKNNGRQKYAKENGRVLGAIPAINAFAGNGANYATSQPSGERDYLYNPLTPEEKEQRKAARRAENDRIRAEMAAEAAGAQLH